MNFDRKENLLVNFPWEEVTFRLDAQGDFQSTKEIHDVWEKYGFFVVKELFTPTTMASLESCTKDPTIQVTCLLLLLTL